MVHNRKYVPGGVALVMGRVKNSLKMMDQDKIELLYDIFMIGALEALIHVGKKYKLPIHLLEEERSKYGNIPETIEECTNYQRPK